MKKLLVHICCAPCFMYPCEVLCAEGFEVSGIYYNPNIDSADEFARRSSFVESYAGSKRISVEYPVYRPEEFDREIEGNREKPLRCIACWRLRLTKTARAAKSAGIGFFSTTLLASPYQDHETLKRLGEEAARKEGIVFYYADFRKGFREAQNTARRLGMYRQKYCGCAYSLKEASVRKQDGRDVA